MASRPNGDDSEVYEVDDERVETIVAFIDNDAAAANPRVFGGSSIYNRQMKRYTDVEPHLYVQVS